MRHPLRYVARVTLQAETPFLIGSGEKDLMSDAGFAADANGLPALPGASIAGVLRHAFAAQDSAAESDLFGCPEESGSRLMVSWGAIHDASGHAVEGLLRASRIQGDPVLRNAVESKIRDHVRIGHRGAAADQGKFDQRCVAAGHRFTFELMLEGSEADAAYWATLLGIIRSETFRLGGKTRAGLGRFTTGRIADRIFDLTNKADFAAFCSHPVSLAEGDALSASEMVSTLRDEDAVVAELSLAPEGFWMFGGGTDERVDMVPVSELRIAWDPKTGKGGVSKPEFYVPGSSVKGAIAHRTAFYHNVERGRFADKGADLDAVSGTGNEAVRDLFGWIKGDLGRDTGRTEGQRGRVLIDDVFLGPVEQRPKKLVNHVSIDRFTGGARTLSGALFSERPFFRGDPITLRLVIVEKTRISGAARRALGRALKDLATGRLTLGAGAGRGNGAFIAEGGVRWSDNGEWIGGDA